MAETKVVLYSLSTCSHCNSTKRLLDSGTVPYTFTDVDLLSGEERQVVLERVRTLNPRCTFPTLVIGDTVIVGYREDEIRQALGVE